MNAESKTTPSERVYRGLLRGLYEGRYAPGQRLAAPDLMRQFDVGRGTIREVLHRLASSGVVSIVPNRGAQVRRLSRREVGDLLDIVELLLGLASRGAALTAHTTRPDNALLDLYEKLKMQKRNGDFSGFVQAREGYYRCIVAQSGNRELQRLFPAVQVHIMRAQLRSFDRAGDSADIADFSALTRAILSGDPVQAEEAGREHVKRTVARVAQVPDRAFEQEPPQHATEAMNFDS